MKEKKVVFRNKGDNIVGLLTLPRTKTDKLILLVHGFIPGNMNGPNNLYRRLAYKLTKNGFDVYRFNFRFTTDDFKNYHKMTVSGEVSDLKLLINEFSRKYKEIGVVGQSMGGAISILGYSTKIKCMVLFYPAIFFKENIANRWSSDEQMREMNEKGVLPCAEIPGQRVFVGKRFIEEINRTEILPKISRIKCPLLFIHGNADKIVSFTESERAFRAANKPKNIEIINKSDHGFTDENHKPSKKIQDKAIGLTIIWFNKWL